MDISLLSPPLWIELSAIVVGALAGAVFAAGRQFDAVGIAAMAVVGGLGGGLLRDILLGTIPLALREPSYLLTAAAAALVGMFFRSIVDRLHLAMATLDTIALGLFTAIGVSRATLFNLPWIAAIVLGAITGVGGGLLLDVLAGDLPPKVFRRGAPYATAALAGATLFTALSAWTDLSSNLIVIACVGLVCAFRGVGVWRGWVTPGAIDVTAEERASRRRGAT